MDYIMFQQIILCYDSNAAQKDYLQTDDYIRNKDISYISYNTFLITHNLRIIQNSN